MSENPTPKKRGPKPKLDPELVAAALAELKGNITCVAARFNVHRATVLDLIEKRPNLQQICKDAREGMVDHAESGLLKAIENGEAWAICFTLKTQGKSRGYVEKQETVEKDTVARLVIVQGPEKIDPPLPENKE